MSRVIDAPPFLFCGRRIVVGTFLSSNLHPPIHLSPDCGRHTVSSARYGDRLPCVTHPDPNLDQISLGKKGASAARATQFADASCAGANTAHLGVKRAPTQPTCDSAAVGSRLPPVGSGSGSSIQIGLLKLPADQVQLWGPIFDDHAMIIAVGPGFNEKCHFKIEISFLKFSIRFLLIHD